jgi:glutamine synthetase
MAPLHTTANIATDHNQLIMETMKRIARNHDLECLLHEKPFNGVNGSGKHNNWSLLTNTGINLLNPGRFPHENKLFLFFLAAIVRAVDEHPELIRMSCSTPGNDFRLGGNEAPPPVISIFIGEQLEDIVEQIIKNGIATTSIQTKKMDIGVQTIAPVRKDATDRNRTSPIAFTGNKFEFRMAASSMSIAGTNMILNTIIADALEQMTKDLEPYSYDDCKKDFETAVDRIIQKTLKDHKRILYNGNSYSEEWRIEAQKRNLPSIMTMVDAIPSLVSPNSIKLFTSQNVLNEIELNARAEINYETYTKAINIEAKTMIQMTSRQYIPAVIHYTAVLADSINRIRIADDTIDVSVQCELLRTCSELLKNTKDALTVLQEKIEAAASEKPGHDRAVYFKENILPAMSALRNPIDKLEFYMDKKDWPVPTYGEMLYEI